MSYFVERIPWTDGLEKYCILKKIAAVLQKDVLWHLSGKKH